MYIPPKIAKKGMAPVSKPSSSLGTGCEGKSGPNSLKRCARQDITNVSEVCGRPGNPEQAVEYKSDVTMNLHKDISTALRNAEKNRRDHLKTPSWLGRDSR